LFFRVVFEGSFFTVADWRGYEKRKKWLKEANFSPDILFLIVTEFLQFSP